MQEAIHTNKNSIIPTNQLQEVIHSLLLGFDRNRYGHPEICSLDEKEIYEEIIDIILQVILVLLLEDRNFCNEKFRNRMSIRNVFDVLKEEKGIHVGSNAWNDLCSIFSVLFEEEYYSILQPDNSCVYDVLQNLLYVNGQAVSYGNTDIDYLGTIYERLMEFRIEFLSSDNCSIVRSSNRRNSGAHYTPRSISQEMVQRTIEPVLGKNLSSQDILRIKICDPAMGSGVFLVESCRYLSNKLVQVWQREGQTQEGKSKEERLMLARCLIAKHCLYGVDKKFEGVRFYGGVHGDV